MLSVLTRVVPPGGRPYCEPYCGSAALLFARPPAPVEVINDMDERIVNVFRVLQQPRMAARLMRLLLYTPYAKSEFVRACKILERGHDDPVLRAWAFLVAMNQGINGNPMPRHYNWGRAVTETHEGVASPVSRWLLRLSHMHWFVDRLRMVQIEQRDGVECIMAYDNPEAVFYVDPPYFHETRVSKRLYAYEMSDDDHRRLIDTLLSIKGRAVLSGYRHELLHARLEEAGWVRIDIDRSCSLAGRVRGSGLQGGGAVRQKCPRTESVWVCPRTTACMRDAIEELLSLAKNRC